MHKISGLTTSIARRPARFNANPGFSSTEGSGLRTELVVTPDQAGALVPGEAGARRIEVVVVDREMAERLADVASSPYVGAEHAAVRIVLVGAIAGTLLGRSSAAGPYDAGTRLECGPGDVVDVVTGLLESRTGEERAILPRNPPDPARCEPASKDRRRGGLPTASLRRVREMMEQRFDEKLELTELAAAAGKSRSHFSRAFRKSVGQSPHRYLMMQRVAAAKALIRDTDRKLTDISVDVGFFDQSHFGRVFTRIVGETPGAYRRRHQCTRRLMNSEQ